MKKSMITICIAAMAALYFPVAAAEPGHVPPVKQEIRVVNKSETAKHNEAEVPKEVTPVTSENGDENNSSSGSAHSGYVIISGAGLLLLIILLILLL